MQWAAVLGYSPGNSLEDVRARYRQTMRAARTKEEALRAYRAWRQASEAFDTGAVKTQAVKTQAVKTQATTKTRARLAVIARRAARRAARAVKARRAPR